MVLVQNWLFSQISFLGILGQENVFYDIAVRKNAFVFFKNKELKDSKNWDFCKGVSPWFCSKIGHFSIFFFKGNLGQENVFYNILEGKNAFFFYKNKELKGARNWGFSKGVSPWFRSKIGHFFTFFFKGNLGQENLFYDILEGKNAFLFYKNKELKGAKNWDFSIGVSPWFWSKIGHFFIFFFQGILGQENVFYDIL